MLKHLAYKTLLVYDMVWRALTYKATMHRLKYCFYHLHMFMLLSTNIIDIVV